MYEDVCKKPIQICLERPPNTRMPKDENDFGDSATIGLHLKRRGRGIDQLNIDADFGVYGGYYHPNIYTVWIKNLMGVVVSRRDYNTLLELKKEWMLD